MMRNLPIWAVCFAIVALVGCGGGGEQGEAAAGQQDDSAGHGEEAAAEDGGARAVAEIAACNDSGVSGTATFEQAGDQVMLTIEIQGATPGEHAFHLHEIGDCSAPDGTSAGGHWNPTDTDHGKWGVDPFHLGDVANLVVGEDGSGSLTVGTNLWTIGSGADNDVVGHAVIVHEGVDDFTTQPTGAAGGRIGCGVIQLAE